MKKLKRKNGSPIGFSLDFLLFCAVMAAICSVLIVIAVNCFHGESMNTGSDGIQEIKHVKRVVIDAGHGGEDGGAVGKGNIFEKDLNLDVAFALRDYLVSVGAEVIMTRTEDILLYDRNSDYKGHKKSQDLRKRLEIAEGEEDYVLVSIHMNAFPDERCSGLQVWYSKNDVGSEALARDIQERVKRGLQLGNNRKIKAADSSMYLLDRASHSAVLIECGFLSNEEDLKNLSDEEYRKKLAVLIGGAVYEHIMLPMSNFN